LVPATALTQKLTIALAVLLIAGYGLGLLFSLKTHREIFASAEHAEPSEPAWPIGLALVTLAVVTVLVALVSEIFVESVQKAAETFGMSRAFVGFIVVALVGGAAEMAVAFSAARKDRLDLSVGIALGALHRSRYSSARCSYCLVTLSGRRRWTCNFGPAGS
jgi:Ca2+:H+ antiporter